VSAVEDEREVLRGRKVDGDDGVGAAPVDAGRANDVDPPGVARVVGHVLESEGDVPLDVRCVGRPVGGHRLVVRERRAVEAVGDWPLDGDVQPREALVGHDGQFDGPVRGLRDPELLDVGGDPVHPVEYLPGLRVLGRRVELVAVNVRDDGVVAHPDEQFVHVGGSGQFEYHRGVRAVLRRVDARQRVVVEGGVVDVVAADECRDRDVRPRFCDLKVVCLERTLGDIVVVDEVQFDLGVALLRDGVECGRRDTTDADARTRGADDGPVLVRDIGPVGEPDQQRRHARPRRELEFDRRVGAVGSGGDVLDRRPVDDEIVVVDCLHVDPVVVDDQGLDCRGVHA